MISGQWETVGNPKLCMVHIFYLKMHYGCVFMYMFECRTLFVILFYVFAGSFVEKFSRSLYVEYKKKGIDVQCQVIKIEVRGI